MRAGAPNGKGWERPAWSARAAKTAPRPVRASASAVRAAAPVVRPTAPTVRMLQRRQAICGKPFRGSVLFGLLHWLFGTASRTRAEHVLQCPCRKCSPVLWAGHAMTAALTVGSSCFVPARHMWRCGDCKPIRTAPVLKVSVQGSAGSRYGILAVTIAGKTLAEGRCSGI